MNGSSEESQSRLFWLGYDDDISETCWEPLLTLLTPSILCISDVS